MTDRDWNLVREAAALLHENLLYLDGAGNYRWTRRYGKIRDRHREAPSLPAAARGAVASRVIPHNRALKRALASGAVSGVRSDPLFWLYDIGKNLGFTDPEYRREYLEGHGSSRKKALR